jgi:hypothetical protein
MKSSITLKIRNYNDVTTIATFGRNMHDAYSMLLHLDTKTYLSYGTLPENFTHFIEYKENGQVKTLLNTIPEIRRTCQELYERLEANKDLFTGVYNYQPIPVTF